MTASRSPASAEAGPDGPRGVPLLPSGARWPGLPLAGLAMVIAAVRLHSLREPLERDLTTYAVIGHGMLQGRPLYADLWDHKPPGIHAAYALAERLFGYGETQVWALGVLASVATLVAVFLAGRAAGSDRAGLWAAAAWTSTQALSLLQANTPNAEAFMNASVAWAFALLVRPRGGEPGPGSLLSAGALLAVGSLFKHVVFVPAVVLAAAHVVSSRGVRARVRAAALVVPTLAAWTALAAWFGARGHGRDFLDAVIVFNRAYAGSLLRNISGSGALGSGAGTRVLSDANAVAAIAFLVLAWVATRAGDRYGVLLGGLGLSTSLMVALPGQGFLHYYQLWLPVVAILVGWYAARPSPLGRGAASLPAGLLVVLGAALTALDLRTSPEELSRRKYGDEFVVTKQLGTRLGELLAPGETFWQLGDATGLYFYSRRAPPVGVFYAIPLTRGPLAPRLLRRLREDLERERPDLVVVVDLATLPEDEGLDAWRSAYRHVPAPGRPYRGFSFHVRPGSELLRRWPGSLVLAPQSSGAGAPAPGPRVGVGDEAGTPTRPAGVGAGPVPPAGVGAGAPAPASPVAGRESAEGPGEVGSAAAPTGAPSLSSGGSSRERSSSAVSGSGAASPSTSGGVHRSRSGAASSAASSSSVSIPTERSR